MSNNDVVIQPYN